jgi:hypothetical protein
MKETSFSLTIDGKPVDTQNNRIIKLETAKGRFNFIIEMDGTLRVSTLTNPILIHPQASNSLFLTEDRNKG